MVSETYRLSVLAKRQREQWGIGWAEFRRLPMRKEAKQSAYEYTHQLHEKEWKKVKKQFPPNLNESMMTNFLSPNTYALNEFQDEIYQAAKRNDIEFFISLGKLVERQRDGRTGYAKDAFTPKQCPDYIIFFWTEGLLWLMTDDSAVEYLSLVVRETFDIGTYQKARSRLKKLIRHPDKPIIGIKQLTGSSGERSEGMSTSFGLELRHGWKLADGRLIKV